MVIRKLACTKCLVVCTKHANANKKNDSIAMYLIEIVERLVSPKMKLLAKKFVEEPPSIAPIREHKAREIEDKEVAADN